MALPSGTQIGQGKSSLSIFSDLQLGYREVLPFLVKTYDESYITDYDKLLAEGGGYPTKVESGEHHENVPIWETIHVRNDVAAPGGTNSLVFELAAADIATDGTSFPRIKQVIMFMLADGTHVNGVITAKAGTPTALTVKPLGAPLPAVVAGQALAIIGNVSSEGGKTIEPLKFKTRKITYQLQIVPEKFVTTGSAMTEGSFLTQMEINGKNFLYVKGEADMAKRLKIMACALMMFSIRNTAGQALDASNTEIPNADFNTTDGAFQAANTRGNRMPIPASMSLAFWDMIGSMLIKNKCGSKVINVKHGHDFGSNIENMLKDSLKYTPASFVSSKYGVDEGLAVMLKFREFTKSGFTFMLDPQGAMDDSAIGNAPGYPFANSALLIPQNKLSTKEGQVNPIRMLYKQFGAYNRKYEVWMDGASGGNAEGYVGEDDVRRLMSRMHFGFEFFGVEQWFHLFKPTV